jgi:hypothetical protein
MSDQNLNLNMTFAGMMPSTGGGGGQFPANDEANPFWRCVVKDAEIKVNAKATGQVLVLTLEGRSPEIRGMTHKMGINIAHEKPEVQRRAAADLMGVVYACSGMTQIGHVSEIYGKEFGVVIKPDTSNKEGENFTRVDHCVFADGRELVKNGVLQPFSAPPASNFQQPGGGFQSQQPNAQPGGGFQGQQFNSGAAVQQPAGFHPQQQPQQPATGTMPMPGVQQPAQGGGFTGAPSYGGPAQGGAPAGTPPWE